MIIRFRHPYSQRWISTEWNIHEGTGEQNMWWKKKSKSKFVNWPSRPQDCHTLSKRTIIDAHNISILFVGTERKSVKTISILEVHNIQHFHQIHIYLQAQRLIYCSICFNLSHFHNLVKRIRVWNKKDKWNIHNNLSDLKPIFGSSKSKTAKHQKNPFEHQ